MVLKSDPHPWLQPVGRRIGVTVFCSLWLGFELWSDPGSMWCWMAAAALGWALWDFFLSGTYSVGD
ncbi:MAG: hypothetical protein R3F54_11505 [Alphaproteobacteria bacterium]